MAGSLRAPAVCGGVVLLRWRSGVGWRGQRGWGVSGNREEGGCALHLDRDGVEGRFRVRPASGGGNGGGWRCEMLGKGPIGASYSREI